MTCSWKPNWEETRQHFIDWWHQEGLVLNVWNAPELDNPHEIFANPGEALDIEYFYTQPEWRARWNHYNLSRQNFIADTLPVSVTNTGPGSLALFMGSEAGLSADIKNKLEELANLKKHAKLVENQKESKKRELQAERLKKK